ncbi:MAG: hypothetical protein EBR02_10330, partial [Alphaproteobacteria bacterium]|nr:hypothetical protein [Alphaproteobacteria bacterium]
NIDRLTRLKMDAVANRQNLENSPTYLADVAQARELEKTGETLDAATARRINDQRAKIEDAQKRIDDLNRRIDRSGNEERRKADIGSIPGAPQGTLKELAESFATERDAGRPIPPMFGESLRNGVANLRKTLFDFASNDPNHRPGAVSELGNEIDRLLSKILAGDINPNKLDTYAKEAAQLEELARQYGILGGPQANNIANSGQPAPAPRKKFNEAQSKLMTFGDGTPLSDEVADVEPAQTPAPKAPKLALPKEPAPAKPVKAGPVTTLWDIVRGMGINRDDKNAVDLWKALGYRVEKTKNGGVKFLGPVGVVRKGGANVDAIREAAEEAKMIWPKSADASTDLNDLFDVAGNARKVVAAQDLSEAIEQREAAREDVLDTPEEKEIRAIESGMRTEELNAVENVILSTKKLKGADSPGLATMLDLYLGPRPESKASMQQYHDTFMKGIEGQVAKIGDPSARTEALNDYISRAVTPALEELHRIGTNPRYKGTRIEKLAMDNFERGPENIKKGIIARAERKK